MASILVSLHLAKRLLADAPGPVPWYLRREARTFSSRRGPLSWTSTDHGSSVLVDSEGRACLIVGMYGFACGLGECRLLVWRLSTGSLRGTNASVGHVDFYVLGIDELELVTDIVKAEAKLRENALPFLHASKPDLPPEPVLSVPFSLGGGRVALGTPFELAESAELLFFVNASEVQLWSLRPKEGVLDMIPQDWFNTGDFDRGYQWPTRAARDDKTQVIVGDGIRIGTFALDNSGRQIAGWLERTV
jgi:hypothetical protein